MTAQSHWEDVLSVDLNDGAAREMIKMAYYWQCKASNQSCAAMRKKRDAAWDECNALRDAYGDMKWPACDEAFGISIGLGWEIDKRCF